MISIMSNDNEKENNGGKVVSLDAFRKAQEQQSKPPQQQQQAAQDSPFNADHKPPHITFQEMLSEPIIAPEMLPDAFRSILQQLAYHFNRQGQTNPKILKNGGMATTTLGISAYSFAPASFRELTESFQRDLKENNPRAYQAIMRKIRSETAANPPEKEENLIIQHFANALIAGTGAYKATAKLLREANIESLSFEPAIVVGHKENDPSAIYVEPRIKLTSPVNRHGDIRTVLKNYLDRVERETRGKPDSPKGRPDLRPV